MTTTEIIARMKENVKVSNSNNGVKSLYDYNKIKSNSDKLFKNSSLPKLISLSKNIEKDNDLTKKVRFNLRKILSKLINECNKNCDNKEKFFIALNQLKNFHSLISSSEIFAPDTISNSEDTKNLLSDIFTIVESYKTAKVQPTKKVTAKKDYQDKAIKDIKEGKVIE